MFVVCLVVLTLMLPIAARALVRFWQRRGTVMEVAGDCPCESVARRCTPTFFLCALAIVLEGWILVVDPPTHGHHYGTAVSVALLLLALVWVGSIVLTPVVVLFNRPKWLVPPHLRSAPGYLGERRMGTPPASTVDA